MRDQDLQHLLRMALETEELAGAETRAPWTLGHIRRRIRFHWTAAAIAAAACVLFASRPAFFDRPAKPTQPVRLASNLKVDVCTTHNGVAAAQVQRASSGADDDVTQIMALLRTWSEGCQCLTWDVYEWTNGRTLAALGGRQPLNVPVDVNGDPPVEQWVILAAAKRGTLPENRDDADTLLDCLDSKVAPTSVDLQAVDYSRVVSACLPADVRVVPQCLTSE